MRKRNDEEFEERRGKILDGALQAFAEHGFERATNRQIAEAAGIGSPGLIYHYFKDKADLLREVVERRMPILQLLAHKHELMALPPELTLRYIGEGYLKAMESPQSVAMMKLIFGESMRRPKMAKLVNEIGPNRVFGFLREYMQSQMDAGRLRRSDPGVAARCFFGPLVLYILSREVFIQPDTETLTPDVMLRELLETFLHGMSEG